MESYKKWLKKVLKANKDVIELDGQLYLKNQTIEIEINRATGMATLRLRTSNGMTTAMMEKFIGDSSILTLDGFLFGVNIELSDII